MAEVATPPEVEHTAGAPSPPPNCAICLGPCTNKCFSDSCMHQFCFKCLLEWSKIKPVCPLCKQSFNSIIHNVKSNDEYDKHIVERQELQSPQSLIDESDYVGLYLQPEAPSRQFQFRTTFTVDPRGELAIQQMLLTHPLTNSVYIPGYNPLARFNRYNRRRDVSSTAFRRMIYYNDLWVTVPAPDFTGRYRDVTPTYFNDNPASRNRLVPWLNRELNALLEENTQEVMHLVDVILTNLLQHHIKGIYFRNLLNEYLEAKTDHFIHEFYNFMLSPYDMIGYDRQITYSARQQNIATIELISDSDSDVAMVSVSTNPENNPFGRPTLEVIEINSSDVDSVILVDSESRETTNTNNVDEGTTEAVERNSSEEENRKPILPLKIRFKHKRQSREKKSKKKKYRRSSSSSSSSSGSNSSEVYIPRSRTLKRKHKKSKHSKEYRSHKRSSKTSTRRKCEISDTSSGSDDEPLLYRQRKIKQSDSEDHIPLAKLRSKEKRKRPQKKQRKEKSDRPQTITSSSCASIAGPSSQVAIDASTSPYSNNISEYPYMFPPGSSVPEYPYNVSPRIPTTSYYGNPPSSMSSYEIDHGSKFNEQNNRFNEGSTRFNESSGRFNESSGRFNESNSRFNEASGRFNESSGRMTEPTGRVNESSGRFNESVGRFNESVCRFNESNARFNETTGRFNDSIGRFNESSSKYNEQSSTSLPNTREGVSVKNEVDYDNYYPGPSTTSGRLRSVIVKKENSKDLWYSRPCVTNSDTSDED